MASDLPARTASTRALSILLKLAALEQTAEDRQTAVEWQAGGKQRTELTGKLQQLLLANPALGKNRLLARRADRPIARHRDAQRHAAHFAQPQDHALLGVGLHHSLDNLTGVIRGAILKKCHDKLTWVQSSIVHRSQVKRRNNVAIELLQS